MQGAQKLRSEVPEGLAPQGPHKKVEAQRRRWTFYETIKFNYSQRMKSMNGNAQIVEGVQRDKAGVGFVAVGYVVTESGEVKAGIKILNVAKDEKSEAFSPAKMENVITGKYPISRPLNQYLNGKPTGKLLEFMKFQVSPEGQEIVKKQGFFPVQANWAEFNRKQGL